MRRRAKNIFVLLLAFSASLVLSLFKNARADLAYPYWGTPSLISCSVDARVLFLFFFINIPINMIIFSISFFAIDYPFKKDLRKFFGFVFATSFFGFISDFSISKLMQNSFFSGEYQFLISYYVFSFFVLFFVVYFLARLLYGQIEERKRLILPLAYALLCNPALGILILFKTGYYPLNCVFPKSRLIHLPYPKPPIYPVNQ